MAHLFFLFPTLLLLLLPLPADTDTDTTLAAAGCVWENPVAECASEPTIPEAQGARGHGFQATRAQPDGPSQGACHLSFFFVSSRPFLLTRPRLIPPEGGRGGLREVGGTRALHITR